MGDYNLMEKIDKNNIQAVNGRDEADESSPDYAISLIIDIGIGLFH